VSRAVVVTGAGTGIGAAVVRRLARDGASVVLVGRRREPIEHVAAETGQTFVVADASTEEGVERIVTATVEAHGGIDGLVLNAGVMLPGTVAEASVDDWRATVDINLTGPFLLARAALPHLLERQGSIVSVASIAALRAGPGIAAYCASKAAVISMTQALAEELGPLNVAVNALCPGYIKTAMWTKVLNPVLASAFGVPAERVFEDFVQRSTFFRRHQTPEEIADAAVYLCRAENVTGITLTVAGGGEVH
jgi:NAD(P)-dependent dehydrogenase (short-subunit alcohol dehydrogenase family)